MGNIQVGQATYTAGGITAATGVARSGLDSLANRLEGFSKQMTQMAHTQATAEAEHQAALDDANNKEFHSESVMTVYGKAYNDARSASYMNNAELSLAEMSNEYAMKHQNDPEGYRTGFSKYFKGLQDAAPTPELKASVGILGKKLANHSYGKLKIAEANRVADERKTDFLANVDVKLGAIVNAINSNNPATVELLQEGMNVQATQLIEDGIITEAEKLGYETKAKQIVRKGVLNNNMKLLLEDGEMEQAKEMITAWDDQIQPGLTIKEHDEISSSITKLYNAQVKQNNANNKVVKENANIALKEETKVLNSGGTPTDPVSEEVIANASTTTRRTHQIAQEVRKITKAFDGKALEVKQTEITHLLSEDTTGIVDMEVREALEKSLNAERTAWIKDPQIQAVESGFVDSLDPIYPGIDPQSAGQILQDRYTTSQKNIAHAGKGAYNLLTKTEAMKFSAAIEEGSTDDVLALLKQIGSIDPKVSKPLYKQIAKEGAFSFAVAGQLLNAQSGEAKNTAKTIIFGSKLKDITVPAETMRNLSNTVAAYFPMSTAEFRNGATEAVENFIKGGGDINLKNEKAFAKVFGTMESYNGGAFTMPVGVTEGEFEEYLDNFTVPGGTGTSILERGVRDMSNTFFNGTLQLVNTGESGKYLIKDTEINGIITNQDGTPMVIEYGN